MSVRSWINPILKNIINPIQYPIHKVWPWRGGRTKGREEGRKGIQEGKKEWKEGREEGRKGGRKKGRMI